MKKIISIVIFILILITSTQNVYAASYDGSFIDMVNTDAFDPTKNSSGGLETSILNEIKPVVNKILGIIQIIGAILAVISIALFGFSVIFASNREITKPLNLSNIGLDRGEKALSDQVQFREWMWVLLIGAILLFSGGTIVRIVYNLFMK